MKSKEKCTFKHILVFSPKQAPEQTILRAILDSVLLLFVLKQIPDTIP